MGNKYVVVDLETNGNSPKKENLDHSVRGSRDRGWENSRGVFLPVESSAADFTIYRGTYRH